jgi:hypothetical protein
VKEIFVNKKEDLPKLWWFWWTLVTIFCWVVGIFILWILNRNEPLLTLYVSVPFIVVAIGQGVLLRHRVGRPILWIVITSIGYFASGFSFIFLVAITAMGFFCDVIVVFSCDHFSEITFIYSVFGLVTGLIPAFGQFLLLRKIPKAGWWIPTVTISYALFAAILIITWGDRAIYNYNDMTIGNIILLIILLPGLALGVPTGVVLQYLLSQSGIQPPNKAG